MLRASKLVLNYAINTGKTCSSLFAQRSTVTSDRICPRSTARQSGLIQRGYKTASKMNNSNSATVGQSSQPTKTELVSESWIKSNYTLETRDDDHVIGRGSKNKRVQNNEEFVPPQMPRLYERLSKSSIQLGASKYYLILNKQL